MAGPTLVSAGIEKEMRVCLAEKKENATRWRCIKEKKDAEETGIRSRKG